MARKRKFATTIRMGAAHNDIHTRSLDGKKAATIDLPHPDKRDRKDDRKLAFADLASVAETVCELHGIREPLKRNAKGHFEKRQPKPAKQESRRAHMARNVAHGDRAMSTRVRREEAYA